MSKQHSDVPVKPDVGKRFDNLFYSKSDEKFIVRALLEEIFKGRQFAETMDVGPGEGHVSEPLARHSKRITMVERSSEFCDLLKQRFENARIIQAPVQEVHLIDRFDAILFSHVLYYHPADEWMSLTRKLHSMLSEGGELIVVLNADTGDWWKIMSQFWDELRSNIGFDYIPLTAFRKQLAELGAIKAHPYRYQMFIDGSTSWTEFVGKQILELTSDEVFHRNEMRFAELAKSFKQVDGSIVLDMRAELIRISAS